MKMPKFAQIEPLSQEALHFSRWVMEPGMSLSAVIPADMSKCGIYVLEFDDGQFYVGQTVNLLSRYSCHVRHQPGTIVALRFAPVPEALLDRAERDVVARMVAEKHSLRNRDLVTLPLRSTALDMVIDPAVQDEWLAGSATEFNIGERGHLALDRIASGSSTATGQRSYERLKAHPQYVDIVEALAWYLWICIPWPHETEQRFWTVTAMPNTARSKWSHRLAALSVNNVEVLVIDEQREDENSEWDVTARVNLAFDTALKESGSWGDYLSEIEYGPVGNVLAIVGEPIAVSMVLTDQELSPAARTLAMGLLRKGPSMFSRFHNQRLADDVFAMLQKEMDSPESVLWDEDLLGPMNSPVDPSSPSDLGAEAQ